MAIFSRRRLQAMLDCLGPQVRDGQIRDLVSRLEHRKVGIALAAEAELGLLWALSQITEVELYPSLPNTKRQPEAFCPSLFPSAPAYIEITAVSDDTFSDRDKMERAANIISQFADGVRKGSSKNLHFHFAEASAHKDGHYKRWRRITSAFQLTPELQERLRNWLSNADWPSPGHARLTNDEIDVAIQWKSYVHREGRTFSTMPPIAYDLEDNPVYKRLQNKGSQLSGVPEKALKCIFLVDAGCDTLRVLNRINAGPHTVSGEQIIWHFLDRSSVDLVTVFSPQRENIYNPIGSPRIWRVTFFDKRTSLSPDEYSGLQALVAQLPPPSCEGYQARSLHRQGAFNPQARGRYLGTVMRVEDVRSMKTEIKFPARLFHELIAGRVTIDQFRHHSNAFELFDSALKRGCILSNARLESPGIDEDDDYLVFEFDMDAAALPLMYPKRA